MKKSTTIDSLAQQQKREASKLHLDQGRYANSLKERINKQEYNILKLVSINKPFDLCLFFNTQFNVLERLINDPSYRSFSIQKKKGGKREIHAPEFALKKAQQELNESLQSMYHVIKPAEVHGFITRLNKEETGNTIVTNALPHVGKKYLLNIDLADFFTSVKAYQINRLFTSDLFGFDDQVAIALTLLTTYQGVLPQGAPTSPVLSNFIAYEMDLQFIAWCKAKGYTYTRYADDLTFSSTSKFPSEVLNDITQIIQANHFNINRKKIRFKHNGRKQTVTGIVVNEKINVDRTFLKTTRAMLNDLKTNGVSKATSKHYQIEKQPDLKMCATYIRKIKGRIDHIGLVRGKQDRAYQSLKDSFTAYCVA